jgi:glycosyltransferase involved in cell wall biosynthesis
VGAAVRFLGFTPDAGGVLLGADVFVAPSWAESFPYSILEAMTLALPTVATRVGGVAEALEDGESGLLVPPRDPGALARALVSLISDPARADEMGARARARAQARFTRERMLEGLAAVYRGVLA